MTEPQTLMIGIAFGESPRWHKDRLWFSDWGAQQIIVVDLEGKSEVIVRVPSFPFCIDWLPDGRLLVVSARYESYMLGAMVTHARGAVDLAEGDTWLALPALRRAWQMRQEL